MLMIFHLLFHIIFIILIFEYNVNLLYFLLGLLLIKISILIEFVRYLYHVMEVTEM